MALVLKDRVLETCTSPGTGTVTLLGAVTGYQSFSTIGDGNTCYYTIADQSGASWEVGIGTYSSAGTLARTTVLSSSSAGALTNFSSGVQNVFLTYPSSRAVNLSSGALTSGRVVYTTTGGSLTDSANLLYSGTDLSVYGITVGRGNGSVANNIALGASALAGVNTGDGNIGIGTSVLNANTSGTGNTSIGSFSLRFNLSGNYNVALGYNASRGNTSGGNNIAIGQEALYNSTTFSNNIAIGYQALYTANTASVGTTNNLAIGNNAGRLMTSGKNNVILGSFSGNYGPLNIINTDGNIVISDGYGNPRFVVYDQGNSEVYGTFKSGGGISGGTFLEAPSYLSIKNTPISLYYTTSANGVPDAVDLIAGELALNTTDGQLFYKDTAGVVQVLANKGTSGGTFTSISATSITDSGLTSGRVTYAGASGLLSDSAGLTYDGTNLETQGRLVLRTAAGPSFAGQIGWSSSGGTYIWPKAGSSENFNLYDGLGNNAYQINNSYSHIWGVSGTTRLTLTSSSLYTASGVNVGIGTSSPLVNLDVVNSSASGTGAVTTVRLNHAGTTVGDGPRLLFTSGTSTTGGCAIAGYGTALNAADMIFYAGGNVEKLRITGSANTIYTASGVNVGIGVTNPSSKFTVASTGRSIELYQNATGSATYYIMDNTIETGGKKWRFGYTGASSIPTFSLYNETDNVTSWVADSSGNLGLGVTPSASSGSYKNLQNGGALLMGASGTADIYLNANAFYDGAWKYISTGVAARYSMNGAVNGHSWDVAVSGSSGTAVTWQEKMRLNASGNLGIGTSNPNLPLDIYRSTFTSSTPFANQLSRVSSLGSGADASIVFSDSVANNGYIGIQGGYLNFASNTTTPQLKLDSSGNLGLGVTPKTWLASSKAVQVGDYASFWWDGYTGATAIGNNVYQSGNTTDNYIVSGVAPTRYRLAGGAHSWFIAPSGTAGNAISFTQAMTLGSNGFLGIGQTSPAYPIDISTGANSAQIAFQSTISSGTNFKIAQGIQGVSNGGMQIYDLTNSAIRFCITNSGDVGIGRGDPNSPLTVNGNITILPTTTTNTACYIATNGGGTFFAGLDSSTGAAFGKGAYTSIIYNGASTPMVFFTSGAEAMRITSNGCLLVGTTTNNGRICATYDNTDWNFNSNQTSADATKYHIRFLDNSTAVGNITSSGSVTSYNVTSDYRLKENIAPMIGALTTVAKLKPVTYKWKVNGSDGQGFIAHELQAVVPDCVTGEKDAVDKDGKPVYQSMDTSHLVATLVSAIQEQQALIESLTTRLTALENK